MDEGQETIAPLTKTLGVDNFTNKLIDRYQNFLARNNLKGSTVGRIGLSLLTALLGVGLVFFFRRGATKALYWTDRAVKWLDMPAARLRFYARVLRFVVTIGLLGLMLYSLMLIWGVESDYNPFESEWFRHSIGMIINVGFVIALATIVWEILNAILHLTFVRLDGANSSRVSTILPIVRNIAFMAFALVFFLMLLSEIGINILPLLAGAGIVGVAIGFGAQTMVKDFLSGFTLILEDVMRVGDVVSIGGHSGVIEKITLRKIQLRDYDGAVYTVPYSAITTVTNRTKDFGMYVFEMGVAYKEDTDRVVEVMRTVSAELRADPAFRDRILDDLEIAGVDRFADSSVVIKARIKTLPIQQWNIGREFNRRMKKAFDQAGIEIPFPQQVTWNMNPPVTVVQERRIHEDKAKS